MPLNEDNGDDSFGPAADAENEKPAVSRSLQLDDGADADEERKTVEYLKTGREPVGSPGAGLLGMPRRVTIGALAGIALATFFLPLVYPDAPVLDSTSLSPRQVVRGLAMDRCRSTRITTSTATRPRSPRDSNSTC